MTNRRWCTTFFEASKKRLCVGVSDADASFKSAAEHSSLAKVLVVLVVVLVVLGVVLVVVMLLVVLVVLVLLVVVLVVLGVVLVVLVVLMVLVVLVVLVVFICLFLPMTPGGWRRRTASISVSSSSCVTHGSAAKPAWSTLVRRASSHVRCRGISLAYLGKR